MRVSNSVCIEKLLCCDSQQVQRLQTALDWHLAHGMLQGPAILQNLLKLAAEDGNATVMTLLLPLFARQGWLVSGRDAPSTSSAFSHTCALRGYSAPHPCRCLIATPTQSVQHALLVTRSPETVFLGFILH